MHPNRSEIIRISEITIPFDDGTSFHDWYWDSIHVCTWAEWNPMWNWSNGKIVPRWWFEKNKQFRNPLEAVGDVLSLILMISDRLGYIPCDYSFKSIKCNRGISSFGPEKSHPAANYEVQKSEKKISQRDLGSLLFVWAGFWRVLIVWVIWPSKSGLQVFFALNLTNSSSASFLREK